MRRMPNELLKRTGKTLSVRAKGSPPAARALGDDVPRGFVIA